MLMVGENLREHQTSLAKTAFPEIPHLRLRASWERRYRTGLLAEGPGQGWVCCAHALRMGVRSSTKQGCLLQSLNLSGVFQNTGSSEKSWKVFLSLKRLSFNKRVRGVVGRLYILSSASFNYWQQRNSHSCLNKPNCSILSACPRTSSSLTPFSNKNNIQRSNSLLWLLDLYGILALINVGDLEESCDQQWNSYSNCFSLLSLWTHCQRDNWLKKKLA